MKKIIISFLLLTSLSCSHSKQAQSLKTNDQLDFSIEEILVANDYLNRMFDKEIEYGQCLKDEKDVQLILRTINDRVELAEDKIIEKLENPNLRTEIIKSCEQACTCEIVSDFLQEEQAQLSHDEKKILEKGKMKVSQCVRFMKDSFCQSPLFEKLQTEKEDFIFEESE